jgi:hypothetical protein
VRRVPRRNIIQNEKKDRKGTKNGRKERMEGTNDGRYEGIEGKKDYHDLSVQPQKMPAQPGILHICSERRRILLQRSQQGIFFC